MKSNRIFFGFPRYLAMNSFLVVLAILFAVPVMVFSQSFSINHKGGDSDEDAVRQTINELYSALGRNDAAALDRIYAADYTLVNESGELTNKTARLAAIKSGELRFESVSFNDVNIRLYGDTAIATYNATAKAQFKGQPVGGKLRVTTTFVKIKGRWQLVAAQATNVKEH